MSSEQSEKQNQTWRQKRTIDICFSKNNTVGLRSFLKETKGYYEHFLLDVYGRRVAINSKMPVGVYFLIRSDTDKDAILILE